MRIKYSFLGDNVILNLPDDKLWELRYRLFDDEVMEVYGLYIICGDKEIEIRDVECYAQGRPELPLSAVGDLYEDIVDKTGEMLAANPGLNFIDIDEIESKLLCEKYEKLWKEKGFIELAADGSW